MKDDVISTNAGPATSIEVVQSKRRMQFLTIHENELDTIAAHNTQSTIYWSGASAAFSFALTLVLNLIFCGKDTISVLAQAVCWVGIPSSILIGGACLLLVRSTSKAKTSSLERIKNESKASNQGQEDETVYQRT